MANPHPSGAKKAPGTLRRRNSARITTIPADGRKGQAPAWPLGTATAAERRRWVALWKKPQAVIWEAEHLQEFVARYVRVVLQAEEKLWAKSLAEARQMEDRLLLNAMAMFRTQTQIVDDEGQLTDDNITDLDKYREALGG
jgi:hypothetical protein